MCLLLQISLIEMSFLRDGVGLVWQPEIASIHKTCLNYSVTWASVDVNGRWSEQLMWPLEKKKRIKLESCLPQPESDLTGTRLSGGKGSSSRALKDWFFCFLTTGELLKSELHISGNEVLLFNFWEMRMHSYSKSLGIWRWRQVKKSLRSHSVSKWWHQWEAQWDEWDGKVKRFWGLTFMKRKSDHRVRQRERKGEIKEFSCASPYFSSSFLWLAQERVELK